MDNFIYTSIFVFPISIENTKVKKAEATSNGLSAEKEHVLSISVVFDRLTGISSYKLEQNMKINIPVLLQVCQYHNVFIAKKQATPSC